MLRLSPIPKVSHFVYENITKSLKCPTCALMVSSISVRDTQPVEYPNDVKFNIYVWNYLLWCNIFVRKMILLWLPVHDVLPCSQTTAFYVLYIICSIWQSDPSLSRYTVVYFLPENVFYCYILRFVIIFFNNLAVIKVLRELNKGIFGNCGNVSLAKKWVSNITDCTNC